MTDPPIPRAVRLMVIAAALLALFAVLVSAVNYDRLRADLAQRSHDQKAQVAAAKALSDAQIAQAKKEAAEQVAVAKAEVQRQLCGIIGVLQPFPVSRQLAAKEGCTPDGQPIPTSTAPASRPTDAAAGPAPAVFPGAGSGSALPSRPPSPRPGPTPTPTPSPAPPAFRVCLPLLPCL